MNVIMNKSTFSLLFALEVSLSVSAQQLVDIPQPCRMHETPVEIGPVPQARATHERKYIIPVVFHVFGTNFNGKTVTRALVEDALRRTNEDFNALTTGSLRSGDDDPQFDKLSTPLNIEFRLAEIGPSDEPTTGVVFHRLESGFGVYNPPRMQRYAWDNKRYMNVYIMNDLYGDGVTDNSGVSWYPNWDMTRFRLARVVYNGAYLGNNTDENFRRVLTHEFGHFLNLAHTFDYDDAIFPDGCSKGKNGEENPGDYVDDTPPADRPQMGPEDVNCLGQKTNWTNYMNYSYVRTSMFTRGQVDRMTTALQDKSRSCLWSDDNLHKVFLPDKSVCRLVLDSKQELFPSDDRGDYNADYVFTVINGQTKNGTLVLDTDYTIDGLPDGLAATAVGDGSVIRLNIQGKVTLGDSKKFFVSFLPSSCLSTSFYQGRQPLTLAADYDASEVVPTAIARPMEQSSEMAVHCNKYGQLSVKAPRGSLVVVRSVTGEALLAFHSPGTVTTLSLSGYGHGLYFVSVNGEGGKTWKIMW